jgi:hypothetical protein
MSDSLPAVSENSTLPGGTSAELSIPGADATVINRRIGVDYAENIELMLVHREANKKWAFKIPSVENLNGQRVRKVMLNEEEYEHLIHEIKGDEKYVPCRPELELHYIGVEEDTEAVWDPNFYHSKLYKINRNIQESVNEILQKTVDTTNGLGVEVIFDPVKCLYILTPFVEDQLILMLRNDFKRGSIVTVGRAWCNQEDIKIYNLVNNTKRKIWRRFVRIHLLPQLDNLDRIKEIETRFLLWMEKEQKKFEATLIRDAADLSSSEDSADEDDEEKKKEKKGKKIDKKVGKKKGEKKKKDVEPSGKQQVGGNARPTSKQSDARPTSKQGDVRPTSKQQGRK